MSKDPALYRCPDCQIYVAPGQGHDPVPGQPYLCPSCQADMHDAEPRLLNTYPWCPKCELPVPPTDVIPRDGQKPPSCPHCGTAVAVHALNPDNPLPLSAGLKLAGVVARLLIKSGVMNALDRYARGTSNKIDDLGARVVKAIIHECAKL